MGDLSTTFDPSGIAANSDAASSALALSSDAASKVEIAQSKASEASAAAASGSDALSKITARSAIWDKASAASSQIVIVSDAASSALALASNALSKAEAAGGAPTNAQYVTLAVDGTLSAERVLTAGTGITTTDAGAGSTITVANNVDVMSRHDWIHEHFDGLNTATIIGQGAYNEAGVWIDDGMAAGSTADVVVKSGADKMLTITNKAAAGATNSYIASVLTTTIGAAAGGRIHFKFRVNQNGSGYGGRVALSRDSANQVFSIYFRHSTTFQIAFWSGATGTKLMDASNNTWYTVDAYWSAFNSGVAGQVYIDGTYIAMCTSTSEEYKWDRISLSAYSPAGGSDCVLDVDDLIVSSAFPLGISY